MQTKTMAKPPGHPRPLLGGRGREGNRHKAVNRFVGGSSPAWGGCGRACSGGGPTGTRGGRRRRRGVWVCGRRCVRAVGRAGPGSRPERRRRAERSSTKSAGRGVGYLAPFLALLIRV